MKLKMTLCGNQLRVVLWVIVYTFVVDAQSSHTMDNILDYYPETDGDGLKIIWAHAVNSQAELTEALEDDTMMLEADVSPENNTGIPIMAHPPDVYSDLTLEEWLLQCTDTDKGMKVDLKDISIAEAAMDIFKLNEDRIHQPLWFNADIVKGPNGGDPTVPAIPFISAINDGFPKAALSLGWTTSWSPTGSQMYTWTMIFDNLFHSYPCEQPVTFPIRAVFSVTSWDKYVWMLGLRDDFSFTVWSKSNDDLDVSGLVDFRTHGDIKRIYYDMPNEQMQEFKDALEQLTSPEPTTADDQIPRWQKSLWKGVESEEVGDYAYLSTEGAGIVGANRGAFIESVYGYNVLELTGKVQFVFRVDEDTYAAGDGVEICIRTSGLSNMKQVEDGLCLYIGRDGEIRLGSAISDDRDSGQLSASDCYSFNITDQGSSSAVAAELNPIQCTDGTGTLPTDTDPVTLSLTTPYGGNECFFIVMDKTGDDIDVLLEDVILPDSYSDTSCIVSSVSFASPCSLTVFFSFCITMVWYAAVDSCLFL